MDSPCQARLRVAVGREAAAALAGSLEADNRSAPPGVAVSCRVVGEDLVCEISMRSCDDPRKVLSLRNTLDDLLISLRAALDSLQSLAGGAAERRGQSRSSA